MKRLLSGIKPTGELTLGNYIGAIKQFVEMQNSKKYESFIFVADLHALTIYNDPKELHERIKKLLGIYLACGLNQDTTIFLQSENLYHTNLSWILECNSYIGELNRMTQFKDKTKNKTNNAITCGLYTYPVLMASDILAYDVDYVPVGIDQKQHVEIARDIAIRFNKKFGDTFKVPDVMISDSGTKIMDLVDPSKKMSKSSENPKGVIRLLDDISSIRKKIMSATTDSEMCVKFDMENKPGISNLINIYSAITGKSIKEIEDEFKNSNYGNFKSKVSDVVCEEVSKIQERYNEIIESDELDEILDSGISKTREIAKVKYELMKERMGLGR